MKRSNFIFNIGNLRFTSISNSLSFKSNLFIFSISHVSLIFLALLTYSVKACIYLFYKITMHLLTIIGILTFITDRNRNFKFSRSGQTKIFFIVGQRRIYKQVPIFKNFKSIQVVYTFVVAVR